MARLSSDANSIKRLAPLPSASQSPATATSSKKRKSTGDADGRPATDKRGKTNKTQDTSEAPHAGSLAPQQPAKRGRGRPSLGKGAGKKTASASAAQLAGSTPQQAPARSTAARPSLGGSTGKRGRGRPPGRASSKPAAHAEDLERGTPSGAAAGRRVSGQSDTGSAVRPPPKKRGRPSLRDLPPAAANQARLQKPGKKAGRPSRDSIATAQDLEEDEEEEAGPPSPPRPYAHVAPKTQHVPPSVISAKWSPLTQPSLATASALLSSSQNPILQRMSTTTNRRTHTGTALKLINHRITRKLMRGLPFPPSSVAPADKPADPTARNPRHPSNTDAGRAIELNFERVLDGLASLERQLEPALASVEVLKRERAREERQLEQDFELLKRLEAGAKNSMREKRNLLKRAHVLTPEARAKKEEDDGAKDYKGDEARGKLFTRIEDDEEVKELSVLLSGHVDSISGNMAQLEGLRDAMDKTRGTLRDTLITHLSVEGYEKVVLGM